MPPRITVDQILQAGLILAGYDANQRNRVYAQRVEWFNANYGAHPLVYARLWEEIRSIDEERNLKYFFLALNWLKNYDTEAVLAGRFNLDEKTIRLWCEYYTECLEIICQQKIKLPRQWGAATFLGIVDGTHCRCYKPQHPEFPFDACYKSYKLGKDALSYEVMISMMGQPIWINGPFPAGRPDIKIFNAGLAALIPAGKLVLGDLGYRGPTVCSVPNEFDSYATKAFKRKHRARMEQYNGRLKNFKILENVFRVKGEGRLRKHKTVFYAVNAIVATQLTSGFPLFDP
jgi:hypothetical protein